MVDILRNNVRCQLTKTVTADATVLDVDDTSALPSNAELAAGDFLMAFDDDLALRRFEIVKVTAKTATTITVVRGSENFVVAGLTTRFIHGVGTYLVAAMTKQQLLRCRGAAPVATMPETVNNAEYPHASLLYETSNKRLAYVDGTAVKIVPFGRPQNVYTVAASDTPAALKGIAQYVCDGTADQDEINIALNEANNRNGSKGATVQLLEGTYRLTGPVFANGRCHLRGSGWSTRLRAVTGFTGDALIVSGATTNTISTYTEVSDLSVEGTFYISESGFMTPNRGLVYIFNGGHGFHCRRVRFYNANIALDTGQSTNQFMRVVDCVFDTVGGGSRVGGNIADSFLGPFNRVSGNLYKNFKSSSYAGKHEIQTRNVWVGSDQSVGLAGARGACVTNNLFFGNTVSQQIRAGSTEPMLNAGNLVHQGFIGGSGGRFSGQYQGSSHVMNITHEGGGSAEFANEIHTHYALNVSWSAPASPAADNTVDWIITQEFGNPIVGTDRMSIIGCLVKAPSSGNRFRHIFHNELAANMAQGNGNELNFITQTDGRGQYATSFFLEEGTGTVTTPGNRL